jgi:predicted nucleic-acid-binding protein
VRITADTNVLVRALVGDDPLQAALAERALAEAELVAVPLPVLCELVWVLVRGYRVPVPEIVAALRRLMEAGNVAANRPAVAAGIAMLEAGGDFADGVIAFEGQWLGAEQFVSFDRRAVGLAERQGVRARLLA